MSRRRGQVTQPAITLTYDVLTLDHTGATVVHPLYDDVLPINAVYIAPRSGQPGGTTAGDDVTGDGSISAPYASIGKALGATTSTKNVIVCRGGVIGGAGHETDAMYGTGGGSVFNSRSVTIQAYRNEQVWFDGNHVVDKFAIFGCNGTVMTHTVQGVGFRAYIGDANASNAGVVYCSSGTNNNATQIVRDVVIKDVDGIGINFNKPKKPTGIYHSVVRDTDSTGVTGSHFTGSQLKATAPNGPTWPWLKSLTVQDCYIARANTGDHADSDPAGGNYKGSFMGGIKLHGMRGILIKGNIIEDINPDGPNGFGTGVWFDVGCRDMDVISNFVRRCAHACIQAEVSHTMRAVSNIVQDGGRGAPSHGNIYVASPFTQMVHNTSIGGGNSVSVYDDIRSVAGDGYGWNTEDIVQVANLNVGPVSQPYMGRSFRFSPEKIPGDYTRPGVGVGPSLSTDDFWPQGRWEKNGWFKSTTTNYYQWDDRPDSPGAVSYTTIAALAAAHSEAAQTDIQLASQPLTDIANRDFTVLAGSPAHLAADPLEQVYADLVGVPAGIAYDLGCINLAAAGGSGLACPIPTWA